MTEVLTLVNIADVYLDDRALQGADAVVEGYAGMGVCSGIENDAIVGKANFLHLVNQFALNIALKVFYHDVWILCLQLGQILVER